MKRLLIVQCAGLGNNLLGGYSSLLESATRLSFLPMTAVFPAVTCTASATMRTAQAPARHGMICNGLFDRDSRSVAFWSQSARLVQGPRIWDGAACRPALLFQQQSLGEPECITVSPAPIHKHHGGMLQALHTCPISLENELNKSIGKPFCLSRYWGPMADESSSEWITQAIIAIMKSHTPDVLLTYLPLLDYTLQRNGVTANHALPEAMKQLSKMMTLLLEAAESYEYECVFWGDYAIQDANKSIPLNQYLLEMGVFKIRPVGNFTYPNLYDSEAFALCDHQIAHIFVNNPQCLQVIQRTLQNISGIAEVVCPEAIGLNHPRSGELIAIAEPDAWFSYDWWKTSTKPPDYASHIDIHNKIGFDPCELFWKVPFLGISQNPAKVKGSHGRTDIPVAFAVTNGLKHLQDCKSTLELAQKIKDTIQINS